MTTKRPTTFSVALNASTGCCCQAAKVVPFYRHPGPPRHFVGLHQKDQDLHVKKQLRLTLIKPLFPFSNELLKALLMRCEVFPGVDYSPTVEASQRQYLCGSKAGWVRGNSYLFQCAEALLPRHGDLSNPSTVSSHIFLVSAGEFCR